MLNKHPIGIPYLAKTVQKLQRSGHKIGAVGFGKGGVLALKLAQHLVGLKTPMDVVIACGGVPPPDEIPGLADLPIYTPVQLHVSRDDEDIVGASQLESLWMNSIIDHGGSHTKGLHTVEEHVYTYADVDVFRV